MKHICIFRFSGYTPSSGSRDETIEKQKQSAHNDIENERNKMLKEAKSEIISTAISTSKEILKRNVTVSDNDEYVNKFIEELNKGNSNE